jgi:glucose-6-phosphate 1-epimerase
MTLPSTTITATDGARAELFTHGAQVTSWLPAGGPERLFLSECSEFRSAVAIRGGIPVIFPQFAAFGPLSKHGFARTAEWTLVESRRDSDGSARATVRLAASDATRALWPHTFVLELTVTMGGDRLELALAVENLGAEPFDFTAALHTYLGVNDIDGVRVRGLDGVRFRDSAAGGVEHIEHESELAIAGEIDRIYLDAARAIDVCEAGRRTRATITGFRDVVLWNPGPTLGAALPDMEPGGYRRMLCVEAGAIGTAVRVLPGERWQGTQRLVASAD